MSAKILIGFFGLILISQMALAGVVTKSPPSSRGLFAADLFRQISKDKLTENVILSPISIQVAMAMAYMGAEGETAAELEKGLRLSSNKKDVVGSEFAEVLKTKAGEAQLNIANKIYVNSGYQLRSTYNDLLGKYFNTEAETVNFSKSADAVQTINNWIEKATNNKISNIMQPGSVDGDTSAVIVNAIYFKGKWEIPFSKDSTRKRPFWVSKTKSVDAQIMYEEDDFKYGEFPELDATAIEMDYKDSDMSMIIILPNERDGLAKLEEKLSSVDLNELSSRMTVENVNIFLPKFQIEFSTSVTDALKAMGIRSVFENNANLSGIFAEGPAVKVSDVQHKAFIDVNEAGSEAAAATILKIVPMSFNFNTKNFHADHPFVFAIKNRETVGFVGHCAQM